jgi:polysaccharide export outer membrane protein
MKKVFIIIIFLANFSLESLSAQELNPGDGVKVTFFNITDPISGDYFVQQDGNIQLPYIGLILVIGREFIAIEKDIFTKYDSLYKNPELTIQPLYKISIMGEVRRPGIYYATGVEKLVDLMALAGGETSDADLDDIYIIRQDQEIKVDAQNIVEQGADLGDIGLKSGDRIYIPRRWWVSARNTGIIISGAAVIVTLISLFMR